jgi:hypothetical protein
MIRSLELYAPSGRMLSEILFDVEPEIEIRGELKPGRYVNSTWIFDMR